MPIQGIDNMLIAPRTETAAKPAHQEVVKAAHDQVYLNGEMERTDTRKSETTTEVTETDEKRERFDAKDKGSNSYEHEQQERKRKKEEEEKEIREKAGIGGHIFDIKI